MPKTELSKVQKKYGEKLGLKNIWRVNKLWARKRL